MSNQMEHALREAVARGEVGVQVAAYLGDDLVLDAWTGTADDAGRAVDGRTLFPIFSVTKAVASLALHVQAEKGFVEYEAPLAAYWPEFGARGKHGITVRHVLTHRSGLPQMPPDTTPESLADWDHMCAALADLSPLFPPDERSTYQALNYGWLIGEVVRRTDPAHRDFATFVREELLDPLGIDRLFVGLPDALHPEVATLYEPQRIHATIPDLRRQAMPASVEPGGRWNDPVFYRACAPGASGIADARSVARLFAVLAGGGAVGGVRLLSEDRVRSFTRPRDGATDFDDVIGMRPWLGVGGFWLGGGSPPAEPVISTGPHVLASNGAGGSIAWADLDTGLAVAICHNRMFRTIPPLPPEDHPFTALGELAAHQGTTPATPRSRPSS